MTSRIKKLSNIKKIFLMKIKRFFKHTNAQGKGFPNEKYLPVIPTLRSLRQEDNKRRASLSYLVRKTKRKTHCSTVVHAYNFNTKETEAGDSFLIHCWLS